MRLTRDELKRLYPNASASFLDSNATDTRTPAIVERDHAHEPLGSDQAEKKADGRFLVRVTSRRKRLLDWDNLCEKLYIDLCRYAGAIPEDSPKHVEIETKQIKVTKEDEEVVIEIWKIQ